jgi:hypothetical protein
VKVKATNNLKHIEQLKRPIKVEVINTMHSLLIDGDEVDLWYLFSENEMQVFVNGECFISTKFYPSRLMLNYNNVIEVAVHMRQQFWLEKNKQEKMKDSGLF